VLGDFHLLHLLTQGSTISIWERWSIFESSWQSFVESLLISSDHVRSKASARSREERWAYLTPYLPVIPTSVEKS
jgi:hypothetical protein